MGIDQDTNLATYQQGTLARRGGLSRYALVCETIMCTVTVVGLLMMVLGGVACYFGVRAGAIALLNAWLLWPLGALACGVAVLAMRVRG